MPPTDEVLDLRENHKLEYMWLDHQVTICVQPIMRRGQHTMLPDKRIIQLREVNFVAMISHIMNNNATATQFLNLRQTSVLTMDQPLYALAKQLQWWFPNLYGEDKYVIILGGLPTAMAALRTIGDIIDRSGWTDALTQEDTASADPCEGFLHASHVTKTCKAHQVTAAALYQLQQKVNLNSNEMENSDSGQIEADGTRK